MALVSIQAVGQVGVNKDLSVKGLPANAWTDALNVRFLNGYAQQSLGQAQVYGTPSVVPYHVLPLTVAGAQYWIYAGAAKIYTVTGTTHTNITRQTLGSDVDYTATRNSWTSTILGGIPILNNGTDAPQQWLLTGKATALSNWTANMTCASLRAYKNFLVALDITKTGTRYPYMVKWSNQADPGAVPSTWDHTDATQDAGEFDLSDGYDYIIDGLALRDSFMIYKRSSIWRMDYTGGIYVFKFSKVLGTSGALNKNCIQEIDGLHFILTNEDVVVHDGFQGSSVLDKQTRRYLFADMDHSQSARCFVFKNPYYKEIYVCYPRTSESIPNRAMVWNWGDKTVYFRDLPSINHASNGPVAATSSGATWTTITGTWSNTTRSWGNPGSTIDTSRALMAADGTKLLVLDESFTFDGTAIAGYLERQALPLGDPARRKMLKSVLPNIKGIDGETVLVYLGGAPDAYTAPTYASAITYTIGSTVKAFGFYESRYPAVKFASGTSTNWRLDSYDIEFDERGKF